MDAKARANFINSVASGESFPCPKCNTLNDPDSLFCASCGAPLQQGSAAEEKQEDIPLPFAPIQNAQSNPVSDSEPAVPVLKSAPLSVEEPSGPESAFAEGLPAWDLVPPEMVIRRKKH